MTNVGIVVAGVGIAGSLNICFNHEISHHFEKQDSFEWEPRCSNLDTVWLFLSGFVRNGEMEQDLK